MKKELAFSILLTVLCITGVGAQTLPYAEIPTPSDRYTAGTVAARMIDGVGFRFYWVTDGLRDADLSYKPSANARTTRETIDHIFEMSVYILNAIDGKVNSTGPEIPTAFSDVRKATLENLKKISDRLRQSSEEDLKRYMIKSERGGKTSQFEFWYLINGPIEDSMWHIGQVVSFRRSSGNPVNPKVNYLTGRVMP